MISYKEDSITLLVIVATFFFFIFTPGKEALGAVMQGFIMALIFFGLLPLGYHFLVLKKKAETFGLAPGAWRNRVALLIPVILGALLVTILCWRLVPSFAEQFVVPLSVQKSFLRFIGYELFLVPILALVYELFFRGFIQKSWLENRLGIWSILVQAIFLFLFLLMTASLSWFTFPLLLFSLFSGFLVWYNNSLLQAWIAQWLYLLLFDVFLLIMR